MSSNAKRRARTSPTTVILVIVLLAAAAGASRLVTPPPALPIVVSKEDIAANDAKLQKMQEMKQDSTRKQYEMRNKMMGYGLKIKKVEDPNTIEVDNGYFKHTKPGDAGIKQVDEQTAKRKAAYAVYQQQVAAARLNANGKPVDKPVLVPRSGTPNPVTSK